jgi:hypothetical protein
MTPAHVREMALGLEVTGVCFLYGRRVASAALSGCGGRVHDAELACDAADVPRPRRQRAAHETERRILFLFWSFLINI